MPSSLPPFLVFVSEHGILKVNREAPGTLLSFHLCRDVPFVSVVSFACPSSRFPTHVYTHQHVLAFAPLPPAPLLPSRFPRPRRMYTKDLQNIEEGPLTLHVHYPHLLHPRHVFRKTVGIPASHSVKGSGFKVQRGRTLQLAQRATNPCPERISYKLIPLRQVGHTSVVAKTGLEGAVTVRPRSGCSSSPSTRYKSSGDRPSGLQALRRGIVRGPCAAGQCTTRWRERENGERGRERERDSFLRHRL